jgi:hypothetical protein
VEEYDDAEDLGYVREDVRGQDAFMARELDLSDDDAGGRGADVYHRALLLRAGQEARPGAARARTRILHAPDCKRCGRCRSKDMHV